MTNDQSRLSARSRTGTAGRCVRRPRQVCVPRAGCGAEMFQGRLIRSRPPITRVSG